MAEMAAYYRSAVRVRVIVSGTSNSEDAIFDLEGHAFRAYDVQSDTLVLVRPDGYIGMMAKASSLDRVGDYLRLAFTV
jgi:hypothetical protein